MATNPLSSRREAERLRVALPTQHYLFLLHQAGTTGWMPTLDGNGAPVKNEVGNEGNTLAVQDRIRVLSYLIDKVVSNTKVSEPDSTSEDEQTLLDNPEAAPHVSASVLARIAKGDHHNAIREAAHDAMFYSSPIPDHNPP